jgi:hypothetical protein
MSKSRGDQRVFSVAPAGDTEIESPDLGFEGQLPPLPQSSSPEEVVFLTHILSIKVAALVHLGLIPEQGEEVDIETAKQMIDTLDVLKKRTSGNLSFEESQLIDASLKELKVAYVAAQSR